MRSSCHCYLPIFRLSPSDDALFLKLEKLSLGYLCAKHDLKYSYVIWKQLERK